MQKNIVFGMNKDFWIISEEVLIRQGCHWWLESQRGYIFGHDSQENEDYFNKWGGGVITTMLLHKRFHANWFNLNNLIFHDSCR